MDESHGQEGPIVFARFSVKIFKYFAIELQGFSVFVRPWSCFQKIGFSFEIRLDSSICMRYLHILIKKQLISNR